MAHLKAIPKKKSGRLLVIVRNRLLKQLHFEGRLAVTHPHLFDADRIEDLKKKCAYLEGRIKRALEREALNNQLQIPC